VDAVGGLSLLAALLIMVKRTGRSKVNVVGVIIQPQL